jgi:hypothetical protein
LAALGVDVINATGILPSPLPGFVVNNRRIRAQGYLKMRLVLVQLFQRLKGYKLPAMPTSTWQQNISQVLPPAWWVVIGETAIAVQFAQILALNCQVTLVDSSHILPDEDQSIWLLIQAQLEANRIRNSHGKCSYTQKSG